MKTKLCKKPGCLNVVIPGKDFCQKHICMQGRKLFSVRRKSSEWHGLYNSRRWRSEKAEFLKQYPYCFVCGGKADTVDHIKPHKGNVELFWNKANWQPLCKSCHSRKTLKENKFFRG